MMPMMMFGGLSLLAGLLTLTLPETRGLRLPQTLEEAESLGTQVYTILEPFCKRFQECLVGVPVPVN